MPINPLPRIPVGPFKPYSLTPKEFCRLGPLSIAAGAGTEPVPPTPPTALSLDSSAAPAIIDTGHAYGLFRKNEANKNQRQKALFQLAWAIPAQRLKMISNQILRYLNQLTLPAGEEHIARFTSIERSHIPALMAEFMQKNSWDPTDDSLPQEVRALDLEAVELIARDILLDIQMEALELWNHTSSGSAVDSYIREANRTSTSLVSIGKARQSFEQGNSGLTRYHLVLASLHCSKPDFRTRLTGLASLLPLEITEDRRTEWFALGRRMIEIITPDQDHDQDDNSLLTEFDRLIKEDGSPGTVRAVRRMIRRRDEAMNLILIPILDFLAGTPPPEEALIQESLKTIQDQLKHHPLSRNQQRAVDILDRVAADLQSKQYKTALKRLPNLTRMATADSSFVLANYIDTLFKLVRSLSQKNQ